MAAFPAEKRLEGGFYPHQIAITKRQTNALLDSPVNGRDFHM
jgi:hypothetical protein